MEINQVAGSWAQILTKDDTNSKQERTGFERGSRLCGYYEKNDAVLLKITISNLNHYYFYCTFVSQRILKAELLKLL
jgi:hypothetical protein